MTKLLRKVFSINLNSDGSAAKCRCYALWLTGSRCKPRLGHRGRKVLLSLKYTCLL